MMATEGKVGSERKTGKFQWFLFVVLIPTIFALSLLVIVLTIAGVNVFDEAQKLGKSIPGISQMASGEEEREQSENGNTELKAQIQDQKAQIDTLQSQIDVKDQKVKDLNARIEQLNKQLESSATSSEETKAEIKEVSSAYEKMEPERAAAILSNLGQEEAVLILTNLSSDERGKVLEQMPADQAASLTNAMVEEVNGG